MKTLEELCQEFKVLSAALKEVEFNKKAVQAEILKLMSGDKQGAQKLRKLWIRSG